MADTKISALTELTLAASTDSPAVVSLVSSSAETLRIELANLKTSLGVDVLEIQVFS